MMQGLEDIGVEQLGLEVIKSELPNGGLGVIAHNPKQLPIDPNEIYILGEYVGNELTNLFFTPYQLARRWNQNFQDGSAIDIVNDDHKVSLGDKGLALASMANGCAYLPNANIIQIRDSQKKIRLVLVTTGEVVINKKEILISYGISYEGATGYISMLNLRFPSEDEKIGLRKMFDELAVSKPADHPDHLQKLEAYVQHYTTHSEVIEYDSRSLKIDIAQTVHAQKMSICAFIKHDPLLSEWIQAQYQGTDLEKFLAEIFLWRDTFTIKLGMSSQIDNNYLEGCILEDLMQKNPDIKKKIKDFDWVSIYQELESRKIVIVPKGFQLFHNNDNALILRMDEQYDFIIRCIMMDCKYLLQRYQLHVCMLGQLVKDCVASRSGRDIFAFYTRKFFEIMSLINAHYARVLSEDHSAEVLNLLVEKLMQTLESNCVADHEGVDHMYDRVIERIKPIVLKNIPGQQNAVKEIYTNREGIGLVWNKKENLTHGHQGSHEISGFLKVAKQMPRNPQGLAENLKKDQMETFLEHVKSIANSSDFQYKEKWTACYDQDRAFFTLSVADNIMEKFMRHIHKMNLCVASCLRFRCEYPPRYAPQHVTIHVSGIDRLCRGVVNKLHRTLKSEVAEAFFQTVELYFGKEKFTRKRESWISGRVWDRATLNNIQIKAEKVSAYQKRVSVFNIKNEHLKMGLTQQEKKDTFAMSVNGLNAFGFYTERIAAFYSAPEEARISAFKKLAMQLPVVST